MRISDWSSDVCSSDLGVRVRSVAVDALCLGCDRVAQRRDAGHRRVLVVAVAHRTIELIDQTPRYGKIRETLPEVDRAVFGGKLRHDGTDGGADLRQLDRKSTRLNSSH